MSDSSSGQSSNAVLLLQATARHLLSWSGDHNQWIIIDHDSGLDVQWTVAISDLLPTLFHCERWEVCNDDDDILTAEMKRRLNCMLYLCKVRRLVPRVTGYSDILIREMTGDREDYFKEHFRISRHVYETLLEYLSPFLAVQYTGGFDPIPENHKLLVFLCYLANQASVREISQLFGISISTVHGIVMKVCDIIVRELQRRIIRWPDQVRRRQISAEVEQVSGYSVVFLDGSHIRLASAINGDSDYFNRKGFPSMQLQVVVDHDLFITSAYTGWPGCTHDARVLRNSQLVAKVEGGELFSNGEHVFADNAYPLVNWLITPFKNDGNLAPQQKRFNKKFSGQRQAVERALGHLKGRFRRLMEIPLHNPEEVNKLIIAGCICHNLCILCCDDVERYIEIEDFNHPNGFQNIFQNGYHGTARRLQLLNTA